MLVRLLLLLLALVLLLLLLLLLLPPLTLAPLRRYASTHGVVFAQLMIDGTTRGVFGFFMQLRDENGDLMPGVEIGEIGTPPSPPLFPLPSDPPPARSGAPRMSSERPVSKSRRLLFRSAWLL